MLFGLARRGGGEEKPSDLLLPVLHHFGSSKHTRTHARTTYGHRSCPVAGTERIQGRVIVVAAAQLAVSSLPRHGKRAPARTRAPLSLSRAARSRAEKGSGRSDSLFLYVKVAFHEHICSTFAATVIITVIRAR